MAAYADWFQDRLQRKTRLTAFAQGVCRLAALCSQAPGLRFGLASRPAPAAPDWPEKAAFLDRIPSPKVRRRPGPAVPRKVVHIIANLQLGGAERQLCNCVLGQKRLGMDVSVLLLYPPVGEFNYYGGLLAGSGVRVRVAGAAGAAGFEKIAGSRGNLKTVAAVPAALQPWTLDILGELLAEPCDVCHCWLDYQNVFGGVAAAIARVPLIVLSTRGMNPSHFPNLGAAYFHSLYLGLARRANVRLISNSAAGAVDYAQWLGIAASRFSIVANGVDFADPPAAAAETLRSALRMPPQARLVAGVFRLAEEKRPLLFLDVVRQAMAGRDDLYAVVAGSGPCEAAMREYLRVHGLQQRIVLLGSREDVRGVYQAADVLLLCSRHEGLPNALLEAQWFGCPVVTTKAGGAAEAVRHRQTGLLADTDDADGIETALSTLLDNPQLRWQYAANGRRFVRDAFGVERMVAATNAVYD